MGSQLKAVFFDIGGTLGTVHPTTLVLTLFPESKTMLDTFRRVLGLKLGVISNTPTGFKQTDLTSMLEAAGIREFFDGQCLLASSVVGSDKSTPAIFKKAAQKAGFPPDACLFIGENPGEIAVAKQAGMSVVLRP